MVNPPGIEEPLTPALVPCSRVLFPLALPPADAALFSAASRIRLRLSSGVSSSSCSSSHSSSVSGNSPIIDAVTDGWCGVVVVVVDDDEPPRVLVLEVDQGHVFDDVDEEAGGGCGCCGCCAACCDSWP